MGNREKKSTFFGGAAILAAGIAIVKLIGAVYKIPLGNILGDEGFGHFNNAYVIYNLLLDFPTAALGGTVDIPTIEGTRAHVKIEPGTQPGKTLRLRGKGLPAVQGYGSGMGDLLINISVYVPKELSRSEKEMLEKMKDSDNFKGDNNTKQSIFERFRNYFS